MQNHKFFVSIIIILFLTTSVHALESNTTNYQTNFFFGSGGILQSSVLYNLSAFFGQLINRNSSTFNNTVQEGLLYIQTNETPSVPVPIVITPSGSSSQKITYIPTQTCSFDIKENEIIIDSLFDEKLTIINNDIWNFEPIIEIERISGLQDGSEFLEVDSLKTLEFSEEYQINVKLKSLSSMPTINKSYAKLKITGEQCSNYKEIPITILSSQDIDRNRIEKLKDHLTTTVIKKFYPFNIDVQAWVFYALGLFASYYATISFKVKKKSSVWVIFSFLTLTIFLIFYFLFTRLL